MKDQLSVIAIMVDNRDEMAPEVQEIITRHGRDIIGRLGVPSASKEQGLITLIYEGKSDEAVKFRRQLEEIPGTNVQMINFPN
ncbi:MAG TPA: hypothetical protein PLZ08_10680 [Bacillota bacterium]|nr:hypothetical protein [Bacillota bacterium]HOL08614.1 hypothetical protein [Bacillota bacterium]HPO98403.1 hypothetical protein [Bacillota bacterium]